MMHTLIISFEQFFAAYDCYYILATFVLQYVREQNQKIRIYNTRIFYFKWKPIICRNISRLITSNGGYYIIKNISM